MNLLVCHRHNAQHVQVHEQPHSPNRLIVVRVGIGISLFLLHYFMMHLLGIYAVCSGRLSFFWCIIASVLLTSAVCIHANRLQLRHHRTRMYGKRSKVIVIISELHSLLL